MDLLKVRRLNYTEAIEFGNRYLRPRSDEKLVKNRTRQVNSRWMLQAPASSHTGV